MIKVEIVKECAEISVQKNVVEVNIQATSIEVLNASVIEVVTPYNPELPIDGGNF